MLPSVKGKFTRVPVGHITLWCVRPYFSDLSVAEWQPAPETMPSLWDIPCSWVVTLSGYSGKLIAKWSVGWPAKSVCSLREVISHLNIQLCHMQVQIRLHPIPRAWLWLEETHNPSHFPDIIPQDDQRTPDPQIVAPGRRILNSPSWDSALLPVNSAALNEVKWHYPDNAGVSSIFISSDDSPDSLERGSAILGNDYK